MPGDDIDKEAAEFFREQSKKEREQSVDELMEALHIDHGMEVILKLIKEGKLTFDTSIADALEVLEHRKCELIGVDPDAPEEGDEEDAAAP